MRAPGTRAGHFTVIVAVSSVPVRVGMSTEPLGFTAMDSHTAAGAPFAVTLLQWLG